MISFRPSTPADVPALRQLWKEAFGDEDAFLDIFFKTAYAPRRSGILTERSEIVAGAYWLDCSLNERKLAYLYAVAVAPTRQGQGLGTLLMERLHTHLALNGYDGVILVPGNERLFQYYRRFGYETVSYHREFTAVADDSVSCFKIDVQRFALLRAKYLPRNAIRQEGESLALLDALTEFYAGEGFVAAVSRHDRTCPELLGDTQYAGAVAAALGMPRCQFRTPGQPTPYAMGKSLTRTPLRTDLYFGFGFD